MRCRYHLPKNWTNRSRLGTNKTSFSGSLDAPPCLAKSSRRSPEHLEPEDNSQFLKIHQTNAWTLPTEMVGSIALRYPTASIWAIALVQLGDRERAIMRGPSSVRVYQIWEGRWIAVPSCLFGIPR